MVLFLQLTRTVTVVYTQDAGSERAGGGGHWGGPSSHKFPTYYHEVVIAHAVLASVSWVIFFPLGAVIMRLMSNPNTIWIHTAIQVFSTALYTAAVGMGVWMALTTRQLNSYHPIIGLVIFAVIWFQILAALVHHFILFPKYKNRTNLSIIHIWLGRILITLGMIDGGLGLKLSDDATRGEYMAYGIISTGIWLAYVCLITFFEIKVPGDIPEKRRDSERGIRRDSEREKRRDSESGKRIDSEWKRALDDTEMPTSQPSKEPPARSYTIYYTSRA